MEDVWRRLAPLLAAAALFAIFIAVARSSEMTPTGRTTPDGAETLVTSTPGALDLAIVDDPHDAGISGVVAVGREAGDSLGIRRILEGNLVISLPGRRAVASAINADGSLIAAISAEERAWTLFIDPSGDADAIAIGPVADVRWHTADPFRLAVVLRADEQPTTAVLDVRLDDPTASALTVRRIARIPSGTRIAAFGEHGTTLVVPGPGPDDETHTTTVVIGSDGAPIAESNLAVVAVGDGIIVGVPTEAMAPRSGLDVGWRESSQSAGGAIEVRGADLLPIAIGSAVDPAAREWAVAPDGSAIGWRSGADPAEIVVHEIAGGRQTVVRTGSGTGGLAFAGPDHLVVAGPRPDEIALVAWRTGLAYAIPIGDARLDDVRVSPAR